MAPTAIPKTKKPCKVVKPKKSTRRTTTTHKNHRFQPFSERVATLKIDPIRRRRNAEEAEELSGETETYFGKALAEWRDLNLSQTFTAFTKDAAPLCEGLPALLYNENRVMDLLVAYIEKGDALAMESLLNLLSNFARDLDSRFELHFQRAVSTVAAVAAKHPDPAVIEWSFTCLAWLFKYLSRLLVPDLRPLYDLMAPYLGKEPQKPFVVRFAAESLSFLMRKAAAAYERNETPLRLIVIRLFSDCEQLSDLQRQGVMTLLTETVRGVQGALHSGGLAVLKCMFAAVTEAHEVAGDAAMAVVTGVLTSLIHSANPDTFRPVQDAVLQHIQGTSPTESQSVHTQRHARLVFTIVTVRKGTRISDWAGVLSAVRSLCAACEHCDEHDFAARSTVLATAAVSLQYATIDAVLPNIALLETLRTGRWASTFLQFCDLFARLGTKRFQQLLQPHLQRYITGSWSDDEDGVLSMLPALAPSARAQVTCSEAFQRNIVDRVANLDLDQEELVGSAALALRALPHLKLGQSTRNELASALLLTVRQALTGADGITAVAQAFALGSCFASYLDLVDDCEQIADIWPRLCDKSDQLLGLPKYWENLHRYLKSRPPIAMQGSHVEALESALLRCLSMPSHRTRQTALDIVQLLYSLRGRTVPTVLETAITIESTPVSFETARRISMDIRRLAQGFSSTELDAFIQKAIPTYCFGLLHVNLTQAWDEAASCLAEVSKTTPGEQVITGLAQTWLRGPKDATERDRRASARFVLDADSDGFNVESDFECSNLSRLSAITKQVFEAENAGRLPSAQMLLSDHDQVSAISMTARAQALRVLNKIPQIAEKRSRMLVPILLQWAGPANDEATIDAEAPQRWNRADQKAMLSVFAKFNNPRVLYRQDEAHTALLNLCSNGDLEIQRSALKALTAWKEPAITKYEERLTNLLDESRFREEVSVFLQDASQGNEAAVDPVDCPKLMPVLLRLIYGRTVAGGRQGQDSRRRAIFIALSRRGNDVLGQFINVALGPLTSLGSICDAELEDQITTLNKVPLRKQLGTVNMLEDLLDTLGSELEPFSQAILTAVMVATVATSRCLDGTEEVEDASLLRSIRQAGIQCLVHIFSSMDASKLVGPTQLALREIVAPRLEKLPSENTQSVSGLLKLISAWSSVGGLAPCLHQQPVLLEQVAKLLQQPTAKDEVRLFILQHLLDQLLDYDGEQMLASHHIRGFIGSIGEILKQQPSKHLLDACVVTLVKLAGLVESESEAEKILRVCADLLTKPGMIVSPVTKVGLLKVMSPLLDKFSAGGKPDLYDAVCGLFSRLHGQQNRLLLAAAFVKLCKDDDSLLRSATICTDMNAVGSGLQEVDHDRRERAFAEVNEQASRFSAAQWQPIIHNCLYHIRDAEDMVNRSSASQALQRFVSAATLDDESRAIIASTLLPGIERGMKAESELVRNEYLQLLGHTVICFPQWPAVNDMTGLCVGGDDEASVFANILHIQQHRRLRALRRLSEEAASLGSSNTTKFFFPLLEHFVFDQAEGDAGRTLSDQAVQTLGALARCLTWPAFRTTFKRYIGYLSSREDHEKAVLRLLGTFVDALAPAELSDEKAAKRSEVIIRDFLPPLTDYVHHKDESTIDRRMPVAITIVKLLLTLPEKEMTARLAPVLSDVCHVLRSRSQEARDQTRKALATVSSLVGSGYLGFILKSLRSSLQRGYQLHVLSFTVHSLLVEAAETCDPGDLDYCIPDIISVILDDIFGVTGQEKDAEEYKSGMKEVKSSKSFDTMELIARITPVQKLGLLVRPLRDLLSEKLDSKMLKKIDDLLSRLRKGLDQNPDADSRDMLVFCHEIVRQVHSEQQVAARPVKKAADRRVNRYLIQMESANKSKSRGATTTQLFKLASFSLNLLRKVLRRHEDLMTPGNMAGFLPIAGDALVQGQEDVQTAAVKLLSTIMKLYMADLDANAPVYVNESMRLIKAANSVTTDSSKAALELITAVLREKRDVTIKDRDIGEVLKCVKADIDEPDRQGIIYKFLRAVLGRKVMIQEVYELMDEVGKVLVTNPDRNVRESARSAYFQFVMEYPQGRDRWNKQAGFFVENLKYERPNGRQSVMELLNQLLAKIGDDVFGQLAFTFFVSLVPVLASDEDGACRQMAGILIGKLFERADDELYDKFMKYVETWMMNDGNQAIMVASLKCWMVLLRVRAPGKERIEGLRDRLWTLIDEAGDIIEPAGDVSRLSAALKCVGVLTETGPDVAYAPVKGGEDICKPLAKFVMLPQFEIKTLAAQLLGAFLSHVASTSSKTEGGLATLPLRSAHGVAVDEDDLRQMCYRTLSAFRNNTEQLDDAIVSHNARNLVFIARCFAANGMTWRDELLSESDGEGEEALPKRDASAIAYLLNRLSYITRQETRFPLISRTAAIQVQASILPHLASDKIPNLDSLIRPLYLLTDPSIAQPPGEAHRKLVDAARELLEAVQKKVGAEAYVKALAAARKAVGAKREERRQKRRIEAVSQPERWAREKKRRVEGKKAKTKEKGAEHRSKRRGW